MFGQQETSRGEMVTCYFGQVHLDKVIDPGYWIYDSILSRKNNKRQNIKQRM